MKCKGCGIQIPTKSKYRDVIEQQLKTGYCCLACREQHIMKQKCEVNAVKTSEAEWEKANREGRTTQPNP